MGARGRIITVLSSRFSVPDSQFPFSIVLSKQEYTVPIRTATQNTVPPLFHEEDLVRFFIPPAFYPSLHRLPWTVPLEAWEAQSVRLIPVRSGLSRHIVRFVESGGSRFAIKETTLVAAQREF